VAKAVLDIKRWGNNLGVRLPVGVAREAHLHADQRVRIEVENGRVVRWSNSHSISVSLNLMLSTMLARRWPQRQ
jgi:antitoxin component of MazEF toxin-antitoxin module